MCFKKPKAPQPTAQDLALEKELEAARAAKKRELAAELKDEKDKRTEMALARAMGMFGGRSLIAGPKGGAGFMGFGAGRVTGGGGGTASPRPSSGGAPGGGGSISTTPAPTPAEVGIPWWKAPGL